VKLRSPRLEPRRFGDFEKELRERARAWVPSWGLGDGERDFGQALLEIAARFNSEVAERLDGAGDKMARGFLDWLAVRGEAARPARMPVVFKLADTASEPVPAPHPVKMQVDAGGVNVTFETETDVQLVPGGLELIVGVDPAADAFYLSPPGMSNLDPLEPLPTQWQTKSFAAAGATKVQLDPGLGLAPEMVLDMAGKQYRILEANDDIVTIEPPLDEALDGQTPVRKVKAFAAFDRMTRNRQGHALYLGHMELLNIESAATLEVIGAQGLGGSVVWQYWGKIDPSQEPGWQPLELAPPPTQQADALVLLKPKGAIEPREIGPGRNSRWIRAFTPTLVEPLVLLQVDAISLRVNCNRQLPLCPPIDAYPSPIAEGMANTTPLVLDRPFFPFGKEPRQFDAFYLGSAEAFSKGGAQVQLCFEMADSSFATLACLRTGPLAHQILAGVARDGHLYLLLFDSTTGRISIYNGRERLSPPSPGPFGAVVPGSPVSLDPHPDFRAALWAIDYGFTQEIFVAVTAAGSVWVWREKGLIPSLSGWESFGAVEPVTDSTQFIDGLVYLASGTGGKLFALREQKLFVRDLADANPTWRFLETKAGTVTIALKNIVPIGVEGDDLGSGKLDVGLVGVGSDNALYGISFDPFTLEATCEKLLDHVAPDVAPAAVRRVDSRLVVVAVSDDPSDRKLQGFLSAPSAFTMADSAEADLPGVGVVGHSVDANFSAGHLTFLICVQLDAQFTAVAQWTPFDAAVSGALFTTTIPIEVGSAAGAPTLLPNHIVVPGSSSQLLVAQYDLSRRLTLNTVLRTAVIASTQADQLQVGDWLALPFDSGGLTGYRLEDITNPGVEYRGQTLYEFNFESVDEEIFVYRAAAPVMTATVDPTALEIVTIDGSDTATGWNTLLLVTTDLSSELYSVVAFEAATRVAELDRPLEIMDPTAPPPTVTYRTPQSTGARLLPLMRLDPATTGAWDAALLGFTYLVFPNGDPERQRGVAFQVDMNRRPILVALTQHWQSAPPHHLGANTQFIVDGAIANWSAQIGDTSSNPELSWEYWNGTGWWNLGKFNDGTQNLKRSGAFTFEVPLDLRATDWSGRANHWIRARLVGGDYGREKVTVTTSPTDQPGVTRQTVERSLKDIRAPSVLTLHISYSVCESELPDWVLAQDGGSIRDKTDANRTGGAIVEAFIPLSIQLGRLANAVALADASDAYPPECDCSPRMARPVAAGASATKGVAGMTRPAKDRALYLGFDSKLSGQPVNVLLVVEEERANDKFAPLTIDALIGDRFVPVIAKDNTRAIGETGLISMSFSIEPIPTELFGRSLSWLRFTPGESGIDWNPTLRGVYLNAVWARAAETMTRELIGSSEGSPNLTLQLARPPLLKDSLELRVKEPLGGEERDQLVATEPESVKSNVTDLPGYWVLWKQVADPNDHEATARVYSLDEDTGIIRFGDGQHGAIPPIAVDGIVAFKYERTEPAASDGVPANFVTARSPLNLVTPVESVEAAIAADQAAGGVAPDSVERVLRFGAAKLRHRGRAVTSGDFEDLALERFADVVQARCFVSNGRVRLIVVMRGRDPKPSQAQRRELRAVLLAASPAALAARGALSIEGPTVRRLRIHLILRVATLDVAGDLASYVKRTLHSFFDTGAVGGDRNAWMLGASPREDDIAEALLDAPNLESIVDIVLSEVDADGDEHPWPQSMRAGELAMLDDDGIRMGFEIVEAVV
jgi:hypothetical protein